MDGPATKINAAMCLNILCFIISSCHLGPLLGPSPGAPGVLGERESRPADADGMVSLYVLGMLKTRLGRRENLLDRVDKSMEKSG